MQKFYYLTQYDDCGMLDSDVIKTLSNQTKDIDTRQLDELLDLIPSVSDKYNQFIYNAMISGSINDDNISDFIELWQALSNEDFEEVASIINFEATGIYSHDDLYYMADEDLKNNGMEANCIYWLDELHLNELHEFNGYENGFHYYADMNEYLRQCDSFRNALDEYLKIL